VSQNKGPWGPEKANRRGRTTGTELEDQKQLDTAINNTEKKDKEKEINSGRKKAKGMHCATNGGKKGTKTLDGPERLKRGKRKRGQVGYFGVAASQKKVNRASPEQGPAWRENTINGGGKRGYQRDWGAGKTEKKGKT